MKAALAWLASFRLRLVFRSAFLLLALAVVAMAVTVLHEEKQRSYDNRDGQIDDVASHNEIAESFEHWVSFLS